MAKEAAIAAGFMVMAFAANAIKEYSNLQRDVGRQLAVSATESAKIQQNFKDAAWHSKDMFATTKALSEMNSILNDARGTGLEIDGETSCESCLRHRNYFLNRPPDQKVPKMLPNCTF